MKNKRFICLLLVMTLLVLPVTSFAATFTKTKTTDVSLLQNGDFDIAYSDADYSRNGISSYAISNYSSASEYLYNALKNVEDRIDVSAYNIPVEEFSDFFCKVVNDNPDLFFVSSSISYKYYESTGTTAFVMPCYSMTAEEISSANVIFNNGVQNALSCVDNSMTDLQKALVIHDYICDNAVYKENGYITHSAYGFFYNGEVVCAGYTLAYAYLLNQLGIDTAHISSDAMKHAWNAVCIDGKWYQCDVTWDDINASNGSEPINVLGNFEHVNFMKSNDYFVSLNGSYHYGGTTYDSISLNNTDYDSYFWDKVMSKIIVKDGYYYYMQPVSSGSYLMKRDVNGNETRFSNSSFSAAKLTLTSEPTDSRGVSSTLTLDDYLYRLDYLDNRFYVTSDYSKVSSVSNNGRVQTIAPSSTSYIRGMSVVDNEIVIQDLNSIDSIVVYDKYEYFSNYMSKINNNTYNNYPDIDNDGYVNAKDYALIKKQKA